MKKYYLFLPITCLLVFSACNKTSALNHFEKEPQSARAIQYTKKADLIYKKEINSMIFLTYLNKINNQYKSKSIDSFLVGIHLTDKNNHDFTKNNYSISLNTKNAINISEVNKDSNLISTIPLKNNWAKYYLIQFKNDESAKMNVEFKHPIFGKTEVSFLK